jgi:hypothetical protein
MVHVLGPALSARPATGRPVPPTKEILLIGELLAQLPRASHISFRLHGGIAQTLAFDAAGFTNTAHYTVEITPAPPLVLWRNLRDKTRNVIRRAREQMAVDGTALNPSSFFDFYEANLRAKGAVNHYDRQRTVSLIDAALRRGVGHVLAVLDPSGQPQAALFAVWDRRSEYYLMSTRREGAMNGATSLLIWESLVHAGSLDLIFDMDGIHVTQGALPNFLLLTGFGGTIRPRFQVSRSSGLVGVAKSARALVSRGAAPP